METPENVELTGEELLKRKRAKLREEAEKEDSHGNGEKIRTFDQNPTILRGGRPYLTKSRMMEELGLKPLIRRIPQENRSVTVIRQWHSAKREAFERKILAGRMTAKEIAAEYQISMETLNRWKYDVLLPAVRAAEQQDDLDKQKSARAQLNWLFEETQDTIKKVKSGEIPVERTGTVTALLGAATPLVRILAEITKEVVVGGNVSGNGGSQTTVKAILIPKISQNGGDGMGVEITQGTGDRIPPVDYSRLQLSPPDADGEGE